MEDPRKVKSGGLLRVSVVLWQTPSVNVQAKSQTLIKNRLHTSNMAKKRQNLGGPVPQKRASTNYIISTLFN